MNISIPGEELEALHRRQNADVLAITVHVQLNPLRLSYLGADGELKTHTAGQSIAAPAGERTELVNPGAAGEIPPPQRVSIQGFEANLFGAPGRPA